MGALVGFLAALLLVVHFVGPRFGSGSPANIALAATSNTLIGPEFWGGSINGVSGNGIMAEGLTLAKQMDAQVIRIPMSELSDEDFGTNGGGCITNLSSLTGLAGRSDYKAILSDPQFSTVIITAFDWASFSSCTTKNYLDPNFYTAANTAAIEKEYTDFAIYLHQLAPNKKFIISNWEGDNDAYCDDISSAAADAVKGTTFCPSATNNLAGLTKWFNARYAGIKAAGVPNVFSAVEFNSVHTLQNAGLPSVLNNVIPNIKADYYLYSAYDSVNVSASQFATDIDTIRSEIPNPNNLVIGEMGFQVGAFGDASTTAARLTQMLSVAQEKNIPYAIVWELLTDPALSGFGMYDTSGSLTPSGAAVQSMIGPAPVPVGSTSAGSQAVATPSVVTGSEGAGNVVVTVPSGFAGSANVQVTVTGLDQNQNLVTSAPISLIVNASPAAIPGKFSATISASPSPCTLAPGQPTCGTTISWQSNDPNAEVWVSASSLGTNPSPFAQSGASGSEAANWIIPAGYTFFLKDCTATKGCTASTMASAPTLASTTVYAISSTPTVTFSANGASSLTVTNSTSITYQWQATNATQASSSIVAIYNSAGTPVSSDSCGNVLGPWVASTLKGSVTANASACQIGYRYLLSYQAVSQSSNISLASTPALVSITVVSSTASAAPTNTPSGSGPTTGAGGTPSSGGGIGPVGGAPSSGSNPYVPPCVETAYPCTTVPNIVNGKQVGTKQSCPVPPDYCYQPPAIYVAISCPTGSITSGDHVTCSASGGDGEYIWPDTNGGLFTAPAITAGLSAEWFTVTVRDEDISASAWTSILVYAPPSCAFSASPSTITIPSRSTLGWICQNPVSCTLTQNSGQTIPSTGGSCPTNPFIAPDAFNGTCTPNPAPATTTPYTLTCQNGADDVGTYPGATTHTPTTVTVQSNPGVQETNP